MNKKKLLAILGAIAAGTITVIGGLKIKENLEPKIVSLYGTPDDGRYSYNYKFESYEGTNISASQVRSLIQLVRAVDAKAFKEGDKDKRLSIYYLDNGTYIPIVEFRENSSEINYAGMDLITSTRRYNVELKYGDTGLVNEINVIGE